MLAVGYVAGQHASPAAPVHATALSAGDISNVKDLLDQASSIDVTLGQGASLSSLAREIEARAVAGAKLRASEDGFDRLHADFQDVATAAHDLAALDTTSTTARFAAAMRVSVAIDALVTDTQGPGVSLG
jgi:hypothetical protein